MKRKYFDDWRKKYREMTFEEVQKSYEFLEKFYPSQKHFDSVAVAKFLTGAMEDIGRLKVFELGGWKGDLPSIIRAFNPHIWDLLDYWDNYDICTSAIEKTVFKDPKYNPIIMHKQIWEYDFPPEQYNVFIASHILEHLVTKEVKSIFEFIGQMEVKYVYIHTPIAEKSLGVKVWNRYLGNHILEIGWQQLHRLVNKVGFRRIKRYDHHISFYKRRNI